MVIIYFYLANRYNLFTHILCLHMHNSLYIYYIDFRNTKTSQKIEKNENC